MPISEIDGCSESHWLEVLQIHKEAISAAGFEPALVSDGDESGVIHKRIIENIYHNPIVVCDVSGRNPNVMFELGLRLAFDKPPIITKDDKTPYSFDTSTIEHLEYPRDLRITQVREFHSKLCQKIKATYEMSQNDKNYTTFLKHFGSFKAPQIDAKEVPANEYIMSELKTIRQLISRMYSGLVENPRAKVGEHEFDQFVKKYTEKFGGANVSHSFPNLYSTEELAEINKEISNMEDIEELAIERSKDGGQVFLTAKVDYEKWDHRQFLNAIASEKYKDRLFRR